MHSRQIFNLHSWEQQRPALPKFDDKTRSDWINFKQSQSRTRQVRESEFMPSHIAASARGSHLLESRTSFSSPCRSVALKRTSLSSDPVARPKCVHGSPSEAIQQKEATQKLRPKTRPQNGEAPEPELVFTVLIDSLKVCCHTRPSPHRNHSRHVPDLMSSIHPSWTPLARASANQLFSLMISCETTSVRLLTPSISVSVMICWSAAVVRVVG